MAANGHLINDSSVLENLGNAELDTPMNFHTSIHSDKSNNSLRKMEKYISERYDETALIHLKEQIVAELRKELSINNYKLSDSSQVINVLNNQIDCLQSEIYFLREEMKEKNNLSKSIMKSQPSINHESKAGNCTGRRNYQNLLTVDKNCLNHTTDIKPDSNTETKKNISSEQSNATFTLIPVSRSNNDIENAKTATLISSSTTTTQTNPKLSLVSNSNSDLVHSADINSDSTTTRNSNESHNMNKSKRHAFIIGDRMLKKQMVTF